MLERKPKHNYLIYALICLCFTYLAIEFLFNAYTMFSVDEFWFAHRAYQYKDQLPYRDFAPYKTVIGYYLLLIPMLAAKGIIGTLIFTKNMIAVLNSIILFSGAIWLARFFSKQAILISLMLILFSEVVLSYSTNIRIDLFAYWFCFISFLLLLEKRYVVAGLFIGLGFCTSQKAIWYIMASNIALGLQWLMYSRQRESLLSIFKFNLAAALILASYIVIWSLFSDLHTVTYSIFKEASAMYQLDWYNNSRRLFWSLTLTYNPLLFLLWPVSLLTLMVSYPSDLQYRQRFFIITYALTVLLCLIPYKQVFPYYMQVTIPVFLILYTSFFQWAIGLFQQRLNLHLMVSSFYISVYLAIYILGIIALLIYFKLPVAYALVCLIPLSLGFYCLRTSSLETMTILINIMSITGIFIGLVYPLSLFLGKFVHTENSYQRENIEIVNKLLKNGGDYLAGIDLLYDRDQPITGLKHLMGPAITYLFHPSDKLKAVMLSSLDEDPSVSKASVISALQESNVKLYVNNYRIHALPNEIKDYLYQQYDHLWGSIYYYAPLIKSGRQTVLIKFSGQYQINADHAVYLNHKKYTPHSTIKLINGFYYSQAQENYRLKLLPDVSLLNPTFQPDNWEKLTL